MPCKKILHWSLSVVQRNVSWGKEVSLAQKKRLVQMYSLGEPLLREVHCFFGGGYWFPCSELEILG